MRMIRNRFCQILLTALVISTFFCASLAYAAEWENSCIAEPYSFEYQDDSHSIVIKQMSENGITYFIVDVQLKNAAQFQTALSHGEPNSAREPLSNIVSRTDAVLAINGDDYGAHKYGTIIRNGELIRSTKTTRHMLIVDENGDFSIHADRSKDKPKTLGTELQNQGTWQTFEFGPELVRDGSPTTFSSSFDLISTKVSRREPRTAIGQIDSLHYVVVVADGRQDGYSIGMTLQELQRIFVDCGAHTAINLDGGGSTELWFLGEIINRPSGGEERIMSDIIFF